MTGGFVYRGGTYFSLSGKYIYGDYCSGRIWALSTDEEPFPNELLLETNLNISSFGIDQRGELFVCDLSGGKVYRLLSDEPGALGDLNQDGLVNVLDIIFSINIILGGYPSDYELWSGDLNQDYVIDILDIVLLINLILES